MPLTFISETIRICEVDTNLFAALTDVTAILEPVDGTDELDYFTAFIKFPDVTTVVELADGIALDYND